MLQYFHDLMQEQLVDFNTLWKICLIIIN